MISSHRRVQDIEILRALAIIMVLAEHVSFNLYKWNTRWWYVTVNYWHGAAGVDLFFAVSGFVIARGLLPRLAACTGSTEIVAELLRFFTRRFWRLQPLAVTCLIIPLVLSVTFNQSGAFHSLANNVPAAFSAFVAVNNAWTGHVRTGGDAGLFFPYWSLSLEEQFYLLLPALALFFRHRLRWFLVVLVVYQFFIPVEYGALVFRPGALAIGVLLAIWSRDASYRIAEPRFLARPVVALSSTAVAIILLGSLQSTLLHPVESVGWGLSAIVAAFLVFAASFDMGYIMGRGLAYRSLLWVGSRSYAIYLVHVPAFAATRELFWRFDPPPIFPSFRVDVTYLVPALAIIALTAEVAHRTVERPGRQIGRRLADRVA